MTFYMHAYTCIGSPAHAHIHYRKKLKELTPVKNAYKNKNQEV